MLGLHFKAASTKMNPNEKKTNVLQIKRKPNWERKRSWRRPNRLRQSWKTWRIFIQMSEACRAGSRCREGGRWPRPRPRPCCCCCCCCCCSCCCCSAVSRRRAKEPRCRDTPERRRTSKKMFFFYFLINKKKKKSDVEGMGRGKPLTSDSASITDVREWRKIKNPVPLECQPMSKAGLNEKANGYWWKKGKEIKVHCPPKQDFQVKLSERTQKMILKSEEI